MPIESGQVVTLTLTVTDTESGRTLQQFGTDKPTAYLHGYDNLVESLEGVLGGLTQGASFDTTIENAYGAPSGNAPHAVPRREFPRQWSLEKGSAFYANNSAGDKIKLFVHGVKGSRVMISGDHPWAGKTIRFAGDVLHVRNATEHEREHGHAHGPGGHHH